MIAHMRALRLQAANVWGVRNIKPFSLQSINIGTHREQASISTDFLAITALNAGLGILVQWTEVESIVSNCFVANLGRTVAAAFVL